MDFEEGIKPFAVTSDAPMEKEKGIIKAANDLREKFLHQASKEIAIAGHNSIYKDPDALRRFHYENYFFGPISDNIFLSNDTGEQMLKFWISYSNSIKNDLLNELEERVNHLRMMSQP